MAISLEKMKSAAKEMSQATVHPDEWCRRIQHGYKGKPYNYKATHNYKAQLELFEAVNQPNPSPAPHDLSDVQRCLFLTGDISRALETKNRLLIVTADQGYRHNYTKSFLDEAKSRGILRVWCDCRPIPDGTPPYVALEWLDALGLPEEFFYGQCETMSEWHAAYDAGSRRMVGNLSVLDDDALGKVKSGEVHVTNETYFNVNPNYPVNWRDANAGVGSNCMAVYASSTEGANYFSLRAQASAGKYIPDRDCVYVAGFSDDDWKMVIEN